MLGTAGVHEVDVAGLGRDANPHGVEFTDTGEGWWPVAPGYDPGAGPVVATAVPTTVQVLTWRD